MENKLPVRCSENENVALHLWTKRKEMVERGGISDNLEMTLIKAYRNICSSKAPIKSFKDLSQIKGVGKWIIRLMIGFFPIDTPAGASPIKNDPKIGKKPKGPKRYVPQKNSVAYTLLITLYRGLVDGVKYMNKQELIDAAEGSGLSRNSIRLVAHLSQVRFGMINMLGDSASIEGLIKSKGNPGNLGAHRGTGTLDGVV